MSVPPEIVEQVKREKARRQAMGLAYDEQPRVAFIVHSFNRQPNIPKLVAGIRPVSGHELIVCDDGSIDGSRDLWASELDRPNDFLIHSNDLHEIRILDRAIRFARADIVCLVQDDDDLPADPSWLDRLLAHFERHPKLAIVGGFMGFLGIDRDPIRARDGAVWEQAPFQFVHHVNIGPYVIRRSCYLALGGWDFRFSAAGEPGIGFDSELCLRAWLNGYSVGYDFVGFKGPPKRYSLDGGTMLFAKEVRFRNQWRNHDLIADLYEQGLPEIDRRVRAARGGA